MELERRAGGTIAEFIRTHGEPAFRDAEAAVLDDLLGRCGGVVATGGGVVLRAEHLCMTMRGARASGAQTRTSALRGTMRSDARARAEAISLLTK